MFEELSGSMLLLGAAGAGKSTLLLDLAERLIADSRAERARNPAAEPLVPVLVDLGDWLRSGLRPRLWGLRRAPRLQSFARWLGAVLRQRYGIPPLVSASWLADNRLVLLLDGLDEVPEGARDQCVTAINDLQASVSRVVVCSRTDDYAELHVALRLQGAVEIRPFRPQQVIAFLGAVSPQLRGVASALAADKELREMVTTPLMLNIMAMAYSEGSAPALPIDGDPETRRRLLFDAYVVEVLARHRARPTRTGIEQTLSGLRALARITASADSGVRVPSPTDPRTMERGLDGTHQRVVAGWLTIGAGCGGAIAATAFVAPRTGLVPALLVGGWLWVRAALHVDGAALVAPPGRTTPTRYVLLLGWSALVGTVLYALARALIAILGELLPSSWAASEQPESAGVCALIACASWATVAVSTMVDELRPTTPVARPLVLYLVVTAAAIVVCGMLLSRPVAVSSVTAVAAFAGVIVGYPLGRAASSLVIGPLSRLTLVLAGEPDPWRPELLRFAADRSLLSFVDIEYRFVHVLVRDHLAECDPPSLAVAVATRRGQLPQHT